MVKPEKEWTGLKSIILTRNAVTGGGKEQVEERYFVSSLPIGIEEIARAVTAAVYGNRAFVDALLELDGCLKEQGVKIGAGAALLAEHSLVRDIATGRQIFIIPLLNPGAFRIIILRCTCKRMEKYDGEWIGQAGCHRYGLDRGVYGSLLQKPAGGRV